jgi:hypothetical protein
MDAVWQKTLLISEDFSIQNATAFARQHKAAIVFPLAFILYENALKIKPVKTREDILCCIAISVCNNYGPL